MTLVPKHLAIIMDGNRRYAQEHGIPKLEGHRQGYAKLKELVEWCTKKDIKFLTVYAFSTENWNRTAEEVSYLLDLFRFILSREVDIYIKKGVRILVAGDISRFPHDLQELIQHAIERSKNNTQITLQLALSYGGRPEIIAATQELARQVQSGRLKPENINDTEFAKHLWTSFTPDPDLVVRTGGEKRLSGFLTWASVYSELIFVDTYWPAFSRQDFEAVLDEFISRQRRFGK